MNRDLFYNWFKSFKKLDTTTSNARILNCMRIEKFYLMREKYFIYGTTVYFVMIIFMIHNFGMN